MRSGDGSRHSKTAAQRALPLLVLACSFAPAVLGLANPPAHAAGDTPADRAEPSWLSMGRGLELAVFEVGQARIKVLRCDPEWWETVALAVTDVGGEPRSPRAWGETFGLSAVVNAGMYDVDQRTHTGYFRVDEHLNNPRWAQRDYRQAACFEPFEPDLPRFVLVDLDTDVPEGFTDRFAIVAQNLRLVRKPGENRWPPDTRPWSEACLGEDDQGRMLWIYCRHPHSMHDFIEILLELPLGLVAAQHLEGGHQAQLWIDTALLKNAQDGDGASIPAIGTSGLSSPGLPVPNVLGLRPRAADR